MSDSRFRSFAAEIARNEFNTEEDLANRIDALVQMATEHDLEWAALAVEAVEREMTDEGRWAQGVITLEEVTERMANLAASLRARGRAEA